ncbi:MAG TPA: anti-anti-sigma factor [Elusimicrobia bacterium]|jgi:anti-anti-sigma factor|nr:anti-anti-sigma factor [Elusimicrobiota bacterium]
METNFSVSLENGVAKMTLAGRIDATNAPALQDEVKKLVGQTVNKIVFFVKDLEYIASAGLRVIVFAKQKLGVAAQVYLIGAQESVLNVVKMSGLDNFMTIQDKFEE